MSAATLNSLNGALDVLSSDDIHSLDNIFRQCTVFITSALNKMKTSSSRQEFNEVLERLFCHLLHHQCLEEERDTRDERFAARQNFFSSCLSHLLLLSAAARRFLAQVLRHFNLYPSSSSMELLFALLSLLDEHPQRATLDTLSEFLELWLLPEGDGDAATMVIGECLLSSIIPLFTCI
jgi:hypothetical protein